MQAQSLPAEAWVGALPGPQKTLSQVPAEVAKKPWLQTHCVQLLADENFGHSPPEGLLLPPAFCTAGTSQAPLQVPPSCKHLKACKKRVVVSSPALVRQAAAASGVVATAKQFDRRRQQVATVLEQGSTSEPFKRIFLSAEQGVLPHVVSQYSRVPNSFTPVQSLAGSLSEVFPFRRQTSNLALHVVPMQLLQVASCDSVKGTGSEHFSAAGSVGEELLTPPPSPAPTALPPAGDLTLAPPAAFTEPHAPKPTTTPTHTIRIRAFCMHRHYRDQIELAK